jgi:hypothetical protein
MGGVVGALTGSVKPRSVVQNWLGKDKKAAKLRPKSKTIGVMLGSGKVLVHSSLGGPLVVSALGPAYPQTVASITCPEQTAYVGLRAALLPNVQSIRGKPPVHFRPRVEYDGYRSTTLVARATYHATDTTNPSA